MKTPDMPADLRIPEGWVRLGYGEDILIQEGDRYFSAHSQSWETTCIEPGIPVPPTIYIRKAS